MTPVEPPPKPKPIWRWALLAGWIAATVAVLGSIGAYVHAPTPDATSEGAAALAAYVVGVCAASAVLASVIVWAIFFFTMFFRRASIVKCLVVLAIMMAASFAVATPLSFMAMLGHASIRQEQIETWNRQTSERVRSLYQATERQVLEAGDLSLHFQSKSEVRAVLERHQRVLGLYQAHEGQLDSELNRARRDLTDLDLTQPERRALLAEIEPRVFAGLRVNAADNVAAARLRVEMANLLQTELQGWTIQGGRVAFYDEALLRRMQTLGTVHDAIIARINARHPTPTGSAQPPQQ